MVALEAVDEVQAAADLLDATYRELPPTIDEFIDLPFYLDLGPQCCDLVRETSRAIFTADGTVDIAVLIWGIGAGKSFATKIFDAYIAYGYLCLRDPWAYYGMDRNGPATAIVNFSVTATQAKRVVFDSIAKTIDAAPCFQQPGFQRDKSIGSELRWPDRGLVIFPGNSEAESAIGYNVLAATVDEANFLPDVDQSVRIAGRMAGHRYDAAEELYNAIAKRIKSRGNWRWQRDSLQAYISSPRYVDDFTERMAAQAKDSTHVYCSRAATWEGAKKSVLCGETFHDAQLGPVPVEYADEFKRNPELARRDLGARPSEAIGGFFSDTELLKQKVNEKRQSPLDGLGIPLDGWDGRHEPPLCIHVDLGLRRDACGICGVTPREGKVRMEFVRRVAPEDVGGEIDFASIRQWITDLRDVYHWRIACISYDGWQSVESRQQLEKAGFVTRELSVDRNTKAYDTLKELIRTDRLDYYFDGMLLYELGRLELIKGVKVDHPPGGSKDVADSLAGATMNLLELLELAAQEQENNAVYELEDLSPGFQPVTVGAAGR